jgi:hypothetical protein
VQVAKVFSNIDKTIPSFPNRDPGVYLKTFGSTLRLIVSNTIQGTGMKTFRTQNILPAVLVCALASTTISSQAQAVSSAEAQTIAQEAYIYFYPLVLMDVSRKHFTNVEADKMFARGPMNTFSHARTFRLPPSGEPLTLTSTRFIPWAGSI